MSLLQSSIISVIFVYTIDMYYPTRELYEYISDLMSDPIVDRKICVYSGQSFPVYQSDISLLRSISPVIDGVCYEFAIPDIHPLVRELMRTVWRNERSFSRGNSSHS